MTGPRSTSAYQKAVRTLKARARYQPCWRCGALLDATLPKGDPHSITLGHIIALEDGGSLLDPHNHAPECPSCNYSDGARRTNNRRHPRTAGTSHTSQAW